jgi:glycosyltransferase involved in cell wall biosynthesis
MFSLLSGWDVSGISLDLYGTKIKPLNLQSGERLYQLQPQALWSNPRVLDRWDRFLWSLQLLSILITRRHDYDIAHFHNLNWGSLFSPLVLHPLGKKVVYTMSQFGNDNPSCIRQHPRGRLQIALMRHFDGFIGISPALVEDAQINGLHNVICLPNFLAIPQLEEEPAPGARAAARARLGIPEEVRVLLFVGSIIKRKGIDILVDAFIELYQQYLDLWLVMVGPQSKTDTTKIDENYVAQQKDKIQQAGLERRVVWAGMVKEQSCLVDYYRSADIFVFPTRNEGFGNVLVEAMSAGLPVVTSLLPGITDGVVFDGKSGFLVEVDQTDQFVHAVDQLLRNDPKRLAMGAAGRRIALERFGFESYCQRLKIFYLGLVEEV